MSDRGSPPPISSCKGVCPRVQLYQAIVFATPVIFAAVLLLLFCLLYIKRRRGANIHSPMQGQFFGGGILDTPAWEYGLSKSFRQGLPIVPFDEKFLSACQDTQCTVCLGDYQMGEKIQQLPACNHSFHVQCIDEWLAKNVTCPICRTAVLPDYASTGYIEEEYQQDGHTVEPETGAEHRLWEGRVVNEAQDQSFIVIRMDTLGGSSDDLRASEFSLVCRPGGEPPAQMERS